MKAHAHPRARRALSSLAIPALALALALSLAGCLVGPDYQAPQPSLPGQWAGLKGGQEGNPAAATGQPSALAAWWRQLKDPLLDSLIDQALKANLDLASAQARLRQARAGRAVALGGLLPQAEASGGYQLTHKAGVSKDSHDDLFQAGLDAAWELDLFGGRRRALEAAEAGVTAAQEGIYATQVSLCAEVALDYVQLRGYQRQIAIARANLEAQERTAEITRKRWRAGFASALDVANAEANVFSTQSAIPVFESQARQSVYALGVLLGQPPDQLLERLTPPGSLPAIPAQIPVGLPSDLLRQRPDIRQAEANLHSLTAQVGVATADLFPKFSLTGSLGWSSNLLSNMWNDSNRSFALGPAGSWSIFNGGALVANVRLQEALRDQAFIAYQKTVLTALQDVENALVAFAKEQQHRQALSQAVEANRRAVNLSVRLYSEGQTDFLNVATAQRSLYASEDALVQSERSIATDLIALYKALGGGWGAAG